MAQWRNERTAQGHPKKRRRNLRAPRRSQRNSSSLWMWLKRAPGTRRTRRRRKRKTNRMQLAKAYSHAEVESKWYSKWMESGAFQPAKNAGLYFSMVIPPPNVTGSLHMGHALNNTLQDILCRFERMRGRDVLWQPGTDHAGIATNMVVERQMMERQEPDRRTIGRAKFLEKVWQWKAESGGTITQQSKRLGASCDWSRERFTMDEGLSKAVIK